MKRFLFDCDGTLSNFSDAAIHIAKKADVDSPSEFHDYVITKCLSSRATDAVLSAMTHSVFWRSLDPIKGAVDVVRSIREQGHEVVVVTKTYEKCQFWKTARLDWLAHYFDIEEDDVIFMGEDRHEIKADVFVDDLPVNVNAYKKNNGDAHVFLYNQAYNRNTEINSKINRVEWSGVSKLAFLDVVGT